MADILGVSSIIVHDLANPRLKDYRFNWNKALKLNGNTGISLQYTHARLCRYGQIFCFIISTSFIHSFIHPQSLERNCGIEFNQNCDINITAIDNEIGRILVNVLAMFDQIVDQSYKELEPNVLINYLFQLRYLQYF